MKKNAEKFIYILINLAFFAGIAIFSSHNFDKTAEFFCPIMQKVYTTNLVYILLGISAAAYISGISFCMLLKSKTDKLCDAYQKRHESISAEKDNDNAKIAALQAKIDTLEIALESALKKKD